MQSVEIVSRGEVAQRWQRMSDRGLGFHSLLVRPLIVQWYLLVLAYSRFDLFLFVRIGYTYVAYSQVMCEIEISNCQKINIIRAYCVIFVLKEGYLDNSFAKWLRILVAERSQSVCSVSVTKAFKPNKPI